MNAQERPRSASKVERACSACSLTLIYGSVHRHQFHRPRHAIWTRSSTRQPMRPQRASCTQPLPTVVRSTRSRSPCLCMRAESARSDSRTRTQAVTQARETHGDDSIALVRPCPCPPPTLSEVDGGRTYAAERGRPHATCAQAEAVFELGLAYYDAEEHPCIS